MKLEEALGLNALLIAACYFSRLLSKSGLAAGFFIGSLIAYCLGWGGWVVLLAFFLGGTAATKFQYGKKERRGVAQAEGGQRRWRHAWANAGTGVLCALCAWVSAWRGMEVWQEAWRWSFVACFAAALSDTLSSEFGQLANQQPWLITTGEEVPIGTDGGITRAGILVGILGAVLLTLVGRFLGLVPVRATLPVMAAGLFGNLFDSYLGATLQKKGILTNEWVNFSNTALGALLGLSGFWLMHHIPLWLRALGWTDSRLLALFL